jgi:hypothetical protein
MKTPVKIGERNFLSKKDALLHYKNILNSYKFGQSLNNNDFEDLIALLNYEYQLSMAQAPHVEDAGEVVDESSDKSEELFIENIIVSKVQFNTKCFEVFYSDKTSCYISYLMIVNRKYYTPEILFATACRNCIQKDLISVKQDYFKNYSIQGKVKCQETNVLSIWDELAVDHRQPNTLSIIIDRFKELNNISLENLEYQTTKDNLIIFKDQELLQKFISYHQDKATLRVVRKECNSSRSAMGRVKRNSKDLKITQAQLSLF